MLDLIQHAQAAVSGFSASGVVASLAVAIELIMRLVPTQKPLSLAYTLADGLAAIGKLAMSAGDLMSKVLPQRLKEEAPKV